MRSRHDLVWLSPRGWERACAGAHGEPRVAIAAWGRAGWPAVLTRAPANLAPGQVALGIALPPHPAHGGKPRIALGADPGDIERSTPALALQDSIGAAPRAWQAALKMLDEQARGAGLGLRVYGSLAFQALTGQAYVTRSSDIDLLLHPGTPAQVHGALALLGHHARALPLDGEIVFGLGQAVAWKELAQAGDGQARVLVKSLKGVALVTRASLLASLGAEDACTA